MTGPPTTWWRQAGLLPLALALVLAAVFYGLGEFAFQGGYSMALGSATFPAPRHTAFLLCWSFFGLGISFFLALALVRLSVLTNVASRLKGWFSEGPDRPWILGGMLLALAFAVLIRLLVLAEAPLADDEGCYRFMARVIASGRLYAPSPMAKLHFDQPFMVNDGKWFSQYFLGWPLLMAPGVFFGITGFMNALYSAATVPALYGILLKVGDRVAARVGLLLFLISPMLMGLAATELSHTSCLAVLAWFCWAWLETRRPESPLWSHALMAACFSLAFLIRPLTALGFGVPFLLMWLWSLRLHAGSARWKRFAAFAGPAVVFAAVFLLINLVQTGSPTLVAYQRNIQYHVENGFRFAAWAPGAQPGFANLGFELTWTRLAVQALGMLRMNFMLFGWPLSFLFVGFSWLAGARAWPWVVCVGSFALFHLSLNSAGIDAMGPVHLTEIALPLIVLSSLGVVELGRWLGALEKSLPETRRLPLGAFPGALLAALVLVSFWGYFPVRFGAVHALASNQRAPYDAAEDHGLEDAVVFCYRPFTVVSGRPTGSKNFVFYPAPPHPDLRDSVLWVNHVDIAQDKLFMESFTERTGWLMVFDEQQEPVFLPLDQLEPERFAPNLVVRPTP